MQLHEAAGSSRASSVPAPSQPLCAIARHRLDRPALPVDGDVLKRRNAHFHPAHLPEPKMYPNPTARPQRRGRRSIRHHKEIRMKNQEAFDKGLKTRREVLGAEYVDSAIRNADEFNMPMQELVTEYCWNNIWNRPGLDRRTRSMLNLAMITALNRPHELKLHVKGAINNGLTKGDIQEVFLQAAIYCGVPAAIDSFRTAREVFKEMGI
jgi:4-carboxymuconolactone decarboxylase